jgi:hypothetical protein
VQIIMTTQFVHLRAQSLTQTEFDQAYRNWEIKSAVIHTKLEAYFGDREIPEEWCQFAEIVTQFYALEGVAPEQKAEVEATIKQKLAALQPARQQHGEGWQELKKKILNVKSELIEKVLTAKIAVLQSG